VKFALEVLFNKLEWDKSMEDQLDDIYLSYIHRGFPDDKNIIAYNEIKDIDGHYFIIDGPYEENTYIPFHRILKVWNKKTGEVFYKKAGTD